MRKLNYLWVLLVSGMAFSQTATQNFVKTTQYLRPTVDGVNVNPATPQFEGGGIISQGSKLVTVTYFDGLGRPIQKNQGYSSSSGKDIVTCIPYDGFGRAVQGWLPYPTNQSNQAFITPSTAQSQATSYYQSAYADTNPYDEKDLELSPLSRLLKNGAPGADWALGSGHEIKYGYETNESEEVRLIKAIATYNTTTGAYDVSYSGEGFYPQGKLYKNIVFDENTPQSASVGDGAMVEFKDKYGRVVLKRTFNGDIYDTYYIYDQYGNLSLVMPPQSEGAFDDPDVLNGLCYQYKYDCRNRMIEKKLPGSDWEYLVYDKLDRLVATGPKLSPFTNPTGLGWMITKYDDLNRPIISAWLPETISFNSQLRKNLQDAYYNPANPISENKIANGVDTVINGIGFRYSSLAYPFSNYHVLEVFYYDDYDYTNAPTTFPAVEAQATYYTNSNKPIGLITGHWKRILETSSLYNRYLTYWLYDYQGRIIRDYTYGTATANYIYNNYRYLFDPKLFYTVTRQRRSSATAEIYSRVDNTYTPYNALLKQVHRIGSSGTPTLLSYNSLDPLNRVVGKKVGGTIVDGSACWQNINYNYNIRGWLKGINDIQNLTDAEGFSQDLFAFRIDYSEGMLQQPYNGNISATWWRTATDNQTRGYQYEYDALNRLTDAWFRESTPADQSVKPDFFGEHLQYNKNGNITYLLRNGQYAGNTTEVSIDKLYYTYANGSNTLNSVYDHTLNSDGFKDAGTATAKDYWHDSFGNMTKDLNKGITNITYNHMNLPLTITMANGTISYKYDATGAKIGKTVTPTSGPAVVTDYMGGFQYNNGVLESFPTPEGYVRHVKDAAGNSQYRYVYNYTDHLGNVRVSYGLDDNGAVSILEENHYYPFGLKHTYNATKNDYLKDPITGNVVLDPVVRMARQYQYNGKEFQDELGLNFYDYGARNYDAALGRWMNIDPLAEVYVFNSPFSFTNNNPVVNREMDGRYFEEGSKDEKRANRIERRADRRADRLERKADRLDAKGKNSGDLRDRAGELRQSAQDIRDMKADQTTQYKYGKLGSDDAKALSLNGPSTLLTGQNSKGDNVVTMFTEKNMGSKLHESRHGGQNARGEYNIETGQNYGVADEISAYRAQYSWKGTLSFIDVNKTPTQSQILSSLQSGTNPLMSTLTTINSITPNFVNGLVDPGFVPIYPPASIPLSTWNSN